MVFPPDPCDKDLIGLLFSDPDRAWPLFQSRYGAFLKILIRRHRFSKEDAEEVYQEVCLRLVKHDLKVLRDWQPQRCPLKGYLVVITESVCLSFLRSSFHRYNRLRSQQPDWKPDLESALEKTNRPVLTPADRIQRLETLRIFNECLKSWTDSGKLSAEDRLLLELRLGGMTWDQVSEVLGMSSATARSRLFRIKGELRQRLVVRGLDV